MKSFRRLPGLVHAVCALLAPAVATSAALLASATGARAADVQEFVRVEGKVTSVSGSAVFVDLGRDDKIESGDRAVLYPPGVTSVEGTLRAVAKSSARLELDAGSPNVGVGVRVEVLVPSERLTPRPPADAPPSEPSTPPAEGVTPVKPQPGGQQVPPRPPPVHPPWTHPPESWATDQPLLGTAFSQPPEERPVEFHGSAWLDLRHTTDDSSGTRRSLFGRMGTALRVTNPFGAGGEIELDTEVLQQSFTFPDAPSVDDTEFVLRRFSYAVGGTRDEPTRWQFGRFLTHEFPALGVVDGVEWTHRTEGGSRFGVNAGGLPEPFPDTNSFDDLAVALFGRWVSDEEETVRLGAALQNTWHEGEQDRTLLVAEADWRPSSRFSWRNVAFVDAYDSTDTLKGSGLELTEIASYARWRVADPWGLAASVSRRLYPELLRRDFATLSPELIQDGELERGSLATWYDVSQKTRIDARVDAWRDQADDGTNAEVGVSWSDLFYDQGTVALAVFRADGSYSTGEGVRASASKSWERVFGMLSYEFTTFDKKDFTGAQSSLAHHALYGNLDVPLGERWNLSLLGDTRFGDEQRSWSAGLALRYSF